MRRFKWTQLIAEFAFFLIFGVVCAVSFVATYIIAFNAPGFLKIGALITAGIFLLAFATFFECLGEIFDSLERRKRL